MGFPPLHKPFGPAITAAVGLPSISPKVITDVQTPFRSLRPHTRTGNSVPEGSSSLGRACRVGPRPGKNWRLMAFGSLVLSASLATGLLWQSMRGTITPWVVEVDR